MRSGSRGEARSCNLTSARVMGAESGRAGSLWARGTAIGRCATNMKQRRFAVASAIGRAGLAVSQQSGAQNELDGAGPQQHSF